MFSCRMEAGRLFSDRFLSCSARWNVPADMGRDEVEEAFMEGRVRRHAWTRGKDNDDKSMSKKKSFSIL